MIAALGRRAGALAADPTLRRWTLARISGRVRAPDLSQRRPPYLDGVASATSFLTSEPFTELAAAPPLRAIVLPLPGEAVRVVPGEEEAVFRRRFADIETLLALHRFSWVPLMGETLDPAWVLALWRGWMRTSFPPREGWAWHPYTVAERAINILDFARRHGLPAPSAESRSALQAHAPAILGALEYFGDSYTSNHLANNGRGLFLLGLALGDAASADIGGRILLNEAKRIFLPSGVLREGSTHYHALLTDRYAEVALAARRHGRSEAEALQETAQRAGSVAQEFFFLGGMPLIGDISPDIPPYVLTSRLTGFGSHPPDRAALVRDGWAAISADDRSNWSILTYASPGGWPPLPGHGHQDMSSFQLHHLAEVVIQDPGRGTYMHTGDVSAAAQNGISISNTDPYPTNRAYYDNDFRREVGGPPPELHVGADELTVAHDGFARLSGVGRAIRRWRLASRTVAIEDEIAGNGKRRVTRRFHTTLPVRVDGGAAILGERYRLRGDGDLRLHPAICWTAYGDGTGATRIEIAANATLPTRMRVEIEIV